MSLLDTLINDRYRLIRKLGEGGMGEVYLAEDLTMQRQVAIKFIRGALGDPDSYTRLLERFQREARTLAKLSHPNIVHVYDYGDYDGRPYLVMEYLPGGSLAERMGAPMPWQEACKLAATVARALAFAHSEGVLHRDIKPSNILFTKSGEPVLSDFGLAHLMEPGGEEDSSYSFSLIGGAQPVGTPAYMAPEQWSGKATEQSDIYSLGVVLFQMLTGQVPYPGKTPGEVVTSTMMNPLPEPHSLNPDIPQKVEAIVQQALARDPTKRVVGMEEFNRALSGLENQEATAEKNRDLEVNLPVRQQKSAPNQSKLEKPDEKAKPTAPRKDVVRLLSYLLAGIAVFVMVIIGITNNWFKTRAQGTVIPLPASTSSMPTKFPTNTQKPIETSIPPTPTRTILPPTPTLGIGSTIVSPKDQMVMIYIPSGKFLMGSNEYCGFNDHLACPQHMVYLDSYWIDQSEVTNGMYSKCVKDGVCTSPSKLSSRKILSYFGNSDYDSFPVIWVNWMQASTYCEWAGRQLPTEAQWEMAARGTESLTFPWGETEPNCGLGNFNNPYLSCNGDTVAVKGYESGKSPYGVYDLGGNVLEWVSNWYEDYQTGVETNPVGPPNGIARVVRGGELWWNSFNKEGLTGFQSDYRNNISPLITDVNIGFRCAKTIN